MPVRSLYAKNGLGCAAMSCEVETSKKVIRSVAAAQGHDCAGDGIGKCGVKIGETLGSSSGEIERSAEQHVGARFGYESQRLQGR